MSADPIDEAFQRAARLGAECGNAWIEVLFGDKQERAVIKAYVEDEG